MAVIVTFVNTFIGKFSTLLSMAYLTVLLSKLLQSFNVIGRSFRRTVAL